MTEKFDTLAAAEQLKQAGFSDHQAKAVVGNFAKLANNMATKEDIRNMATKQDVAHCWRVMLGILVPLQLLVLGVVLTK